MIPQSVLLWGISVILAIQALGSPLLDSIVRALNLLGTEDLYVVVLSALYWCINRQAAVQLAPIFLFSDYAARFLKDITGVPRPYDLEPRIRNLDPQTDLSFPSAAVQSAAAFWLVLALLFRRAWLWIAAAFFIILVAFARVYLGAHYPTDVLASVLFAAIIIFVLMRIDFRSLAMRVVSGWGLALLLVPFALAAVHLNGETATDMGVLLGFLVGVAIEERYVPFETSARAWQQVAKLIVGLAVAFAIRVLLKAILPEGAWFSFARYAVLGVWVAAAAPWAFVRVGLAAREQTASTAPSPAIA